jgi:predicted  nucleic acid-binding Zn-ribbon protein
MSRAARLYLLQQLDLEEETGRHRLGEIAAALGETRTLRQAREVAQKASDQVQRWATRQRDLELEVQGLKDEIAASENRLYGGSIRNPKELGDLQAKVGSLKRYLERKEEDLLEAMIAWDDARESSDRSQAELREVETSWAADQGALKSEQQRLEERVAEITQERGALLPTISAEDIDVYQTLRRTKGGLAVGVLRAGGCMACGMEVPPGRLERGREKGLLSCGNCERILVPEAEIDR